MPYVMVTKKDARGQRRVEITGPSFTIGRAPSNMLVLPDDRVSRHHCVIETVKDAIRIRDLGAHNGTKVNYDRRRECTLSDGDFIRIGPYDLRFYAFGPLPADDAGSGLMNGSPDAKDVSRPGETVASGWSQEPDLVVDQESEEDDAVVASLRAELAQVKSERSDRQRELQARIEQLESDVAESAAVAKAAETAQTEPADREQEFEARTEQLEQDRAELARRAEAAEAELHRVKSAEAERAQSVALQIEQLEDELADGEKRLIAAEAKWNAAQDRAGRAEADRAGDRIALAELEDQTGAQQTAIADLRQSLEVSRQEQSRLHEEHGELSSRLRDMQQQLLAAEEASADLHTAHDQAKNEVANVMDARATTAREAQELRQRLESATAELESIRQARADLEQQRHDVGNQHAEARRQLRLAGEERNELARHVDDLESLLQDANRTIEESQNAQVVIGRHRDALSQRIEEASDSLKDETKRIEELETQLEQAQERAACTSADRETFINRAGEVVARGEEAMRHGGGEDADMQVVLSEIAALHRQRLSLEAELNESRVQIEELEKTSPLSSGQAASSLARPAPIVSEIPGLMPAIAECFAGDESRAPRYREDRDWVKWPITIVLLLIGIAILAWVLLRQLS